MSFGFNDVIKLIVLNVFVFVFTYFIRDNYKIYEIIVAMIFVTIIYIVTGIFMKQKKEVS